MDYITSDNAGLLHKFNQMAEAYKLHPMDFVVAVQEGDLGKPRLEVEVMPQNEKDYQAAEKMLKNAGFSLPPRNPREAMDADIQSPTLTAHDGDAGYKRTFYDAMNAAIAMAPQSRIR